VLAASISLLGAATAASASTASTSRVVGYTYLNGNKVKPAGLVTRGWFHGLNGQGRSNCDSGGGVHAWKLVAGTGLIR
jgi:hypothetical protein